MTDDPTTVDPVAAHTAAWADREPVVEAAPVLRTNRGWPVIGWTTVFLPFAVAAAWFLAQWTVDAQAPQVVPQPPATVVVTTNPPPPAVTVTRRAPAPPAATVTVRPTPTSAPPSTPAPSTTPTSTPSTTSTSGTTSIGELLR